MCIHTYSHVHIWTCKYTCIHTYIGTHTHKFPERSSFSKADWLLRALVMQNSRNVASPEPKSNHLGPAFSPFIAICCPPIYELICNVTSRQTLCNVPSISPKPNNVVSNEACIVEISAMYLKKMSRFILFCYVTTKTMELLLCLGHGLGVT